MNKKRKYVRKGRKIDIILMILLVLIGLIFVDIIDINQGKNFPINIIDEPLMILFGFILGYLFAKFRFMKIIKES